MRKIHLFFILFLLPAALLAQQKTKIFLERSEVGSSSGQDKITYLKRPVFRHAGATLTCDSAVLYEARNAFEAFNNVHIVQGDTINIYSDHLIYEGDTKTAHLTNNVRMIDKESVLTTNNLDYNMGTKVGTYVQGGKIVNKDVTLTSRNGYYFSNSRDAYFRYNVFVVTPETRITSDTMRYNTLTNWAYFYGPTNIKGKGDNLYTENGAYNTKTEYAYFGKKNLYTNGSKSLKGDSLYYDGIAGYGKAVRNIVFRDTTDKTVLYGQLGFYYKADERALVTRNAYVGMGTSDSVTVNKKLVPDSIWMGADTLETQMVQRGTLKLLSFPILKKDNELGEEDSPATEDKKPSAGLPKLPVKMPAGRIAPKSRPGSKSKAKKGLPAVPRYSLNTDSLLRSSLAKDSLQRAKERPRLIKDKVPAPAPARGKTTPAPKTLPKDSLGKDNLKKPVKLPDTVFTNPQDTIKTRIIKAYHHVRVYKSNMQALADSLFYTSADSTLRWFSNPILWSQGSQQTGDTIYLRLKNKKLNTLQVLENGFLVNVNADSTRHNQVKGKLFTAFFKNGELSTMFVDGNAESIYYIRDKDSAYTDMNQTVSARIKTLFKNKEITNLLTIKDPEGAKIPIAELKEEKFLTGFSWKPELRPLSKKEIISGKKTTTGKQPAKAGAADPKSQTRKINVKNGKVIETRSGKPLNVPVPLKADSLLKTAPPLKKEADSLVKELRADSVVKQADSLLKKARPLPSKKQ